MFEAWLVAFAFELVCGSIVGPFGRYMSNLDEP
ncbi:MAG: hypothetical protein JWN07_112 [Hyphomicrobiales bacterium]|nr:hypothetical protein [Hyphomicrobiales bacterium]